MNSNDAYAYAWEHAQQNPDGSRIEASMVDLLAANIDFDVTKANRLVLHWRADLTPHPADVVISRHQATRHQP